MSIGTIVSLPSEYSSYARVRDEYGQERTVDGSQIPRSAEEGDTFAYTVDIAPYRTNDAVTLIRGYSKK